mgnify:FL=1|tara:strand:+ start:2519 stop:3067 length:549 start_codon:yes stop_codon:yes gene_type:complete
MGEIGKDFKYKLIKNLISKQEVSLLSPYCEIKHRSNFEEFDTKQSNISDTGFYGDPIMDSLMLKYCKKISIITNKKILPTYSYWRMYTKGAVLKKHTDRSSCEISVTINIATDGTKWPMFIEGNSVDLEPGDGAVYLGCELTHWREEFKGDYQAQAFLHYVDSSGKNKDYFMDKRELWGTKR